MQMQLKVLKLELFYNSAAARMFQHDTRYLSPFPAESAEHFSRRLLAWLCLYELHPALAAQQAKGPDLYVLDTLSIARYLSSHRQQANVQVCEIPDTTVAQCLNMLRAGMQWSVWRDDLQLQITDGDQMLELDMPQLSAGLH